MWPLYGNNCGCLIPLIIFAILYGSWRYGGWDYLGWWGSGWGSALEDVTVVDDWSPAQQRWRKDEGPLPEPEIPPPVQADPDFHDPELEALIDAFKLREAREYLQGMIDVSREMKDPATEANYRRYEKLIAEASLDGRRIEHKDSDNGQMSVP